MVSTVPLPGPVSAMTAGFLKREVMPRNIRNLDTPVCRWASRDALESLGGTCGSCCGVPKVDNESVVETDVCLMLGLEFFLNFVKLVERLVETVFNVVRRGLDTDASAADSLGCDPTSVEDSCDSGIDFARLGALASLFVWIERASVCSIEGWGAGEVQRTFSLELDCCSTSFESGETGSGTSVHDLKDCSSEEF